MKDILERSELASESILSGMTSRGVVESLFRGENCDQCDE